MRENYLYLIFYCKKAILGGKIVLVSLITEESQGADTVTGKSYLYIKAQGLPSSVE